MSPTPCSQTIQPLATGPGAAGPFGAALADPLWMLGRQWQMGERRGHDGGYPTRARYGVRRADLAPIAGHDPTTTPIEPILEGASEDAWTPSARTRAGRLIAGRHPELGQRADLTLNGLPVPYNVLDGSGLDGLVLWRQRGPLGLEVEEFGDFAPKPRADFYDPATFRHDVPARAGSIALRAEGHRGGAADWFSFDRVPAPDAAPLDPRRPGPGLPDPDPDAPRRHVYTKRVDLPGAPRPGWFALGDLDADFMRGGAEPGQDGLAEYMVRLGRVRHWLTLPVRDRAGALLRVTDLALIDTFGTEIPVSSPGPLSPRAFATTGLPTDHVLLLSAAPEALTGPEEDVVDLAPDEIANLIWAVESRVRGRDVPSVLPDEARVPASAPALIGGAEALDYAHRTTPQPRFLAYVTDPSSPPGTWVVQAELREPNGRARRARSALLADPTPGIAHRIRRGAIPPSGLTLTTRYRMLRDVGGRPILWLERRARRPGVRPERTFRFDVLVPSAGA